MQFNFNINNLNIQEKIEKIDKSIFYDITIIGAGPAGMTASVYCMRKGVKTALISKNTGGQVLETAAIENYMGYKFINGLELAAKFKEQVEQFGIDYNENTSVSKIVEKNDNKTNYFEIHTEDKSIFKSKSIIITTGKSNRKLNVPGEDKFIGKGVAFCATCDAPFYKNKKVAVAGGGNSGVEAALDLAVVAEEVTLIQSMDKLTADQVLIDKMNNYSNLKVLTNANILSINGDKKVESIELEINNKKSKLECDGIFIEIGLKPNTDFIKDLLKLNSQNEIIVDCACRTSIPGIFAAGDVTNVPFKQIIIASGEGSKAALSACDHIHRNS